MVYAMLTEHINSVSEVILRREGKNKIIISTINPLTDEQMQDLYWSVLLMHRTGMTLKEIINKSKEND